MISHLNGGNLPFPFTTAEDYMAKDGIDWTGVGWDGTLPEDEFKPAQFEQLRQAVQRGEVRAVSAAAALSNQAHRDQRYLWRMFGHPGTEVGPHERRVVRPKTPQRIEAERRLDADFGGDVLAMVESLRKDSDDAP